MCVAPLDERADECRRRLRRLRGRRAGPGARAGPGPGRLGGGAGQPRRPAARARPGSGGAARAGPRRGRRDLRPVLVAGQRLAGLLRSGRARADPDHDGPAGRRHAGRGDPAAVRRLRPDVHLGRALPGLPVPAQLRPDLRRARVRPHLPGVLGGRSWCRWPRARRRRSGPARTAARCRPRTRDPEDPPAPEPADGAEDAPRPASSDADEHGARRRRSDKPPDGDRRRGGAGRPGGADPGGRRPLRGHARRQELPALVPAPRWPACWATAGPAPRTSRSARCWSATT